MSIRTLILVFFLSTLDVYGQPLESRFNYSVDHPEAGQQVSFYYTSDPGAGNIIAKIFFSGLNPPKSGNWVDIFPMVTDIPLHGSNGVLQGTTIVPPKATAILTVLMDSLGQVVDNNNGMGYSIPVFQGGKTLPGALSGIAEFYSGYTQAETFHVSTLKDIARTLYETDFDQYPEIKRNFVLQYLKTLNLANDADKKLYKKELSAFALRNDLGEWDLYHTSRGFRLLGEPDSAKKYEEKIFQVFPNGSWTRQSKSLQPAIKISGEKSYEKKKAMFTEYKEKYAGHYDDDFTKIILTTRLFRLLREMIPSMVKNNEMHLWQNEADSLEGAFKFYVFKDAARYLTDHERNSIELVKPANSIKIESPFQTPLIPKENEVLAISEGLAREAVDWWRNNLDAPRRWNDGSYFTDNEIYRKRQEILGETLDVLGQTLILENKPEEASAVLKEAVELTKRKNEEINEHYIEALIKTNQMQEALAEAEIAVKSGASTAKINNFYKELSNQTSLQREAMDDLKMSLKKLMISEKTPEYSLVDMNQVPVSLKHLKNKIVVTVFWDSSNPLCIGSFESLHEVMENYKNDPDVVFLFINIETITDKSIARAKQKIKDQGYEFQSYFDPGTKTTFSLGVNVLPTKIIIDKSGHIRFRDIGLRGGKQQQIDRITAMIQMLK